MNRTGCAKVASGRRTTSSVRPIAMTRADVEAGRDAGARSSVDPRRGRHPVIAPVFLQQRPQHLIEVLVRRGAPIGGARLPAPRRACAARRWRGRSAAARAPRDDGCRGCRTRRSRPAARLREKCRCRATTGAIVHSHSAASNDGSSCRTCTRPTMVRATAERDHVGERRRRSRARARSARSSSCTHVRHRLVEAETGRVAERQQIHQRTEILRDRLAQRHDAAVQRRQLVAPGRRR